METNELLNVMQYALRNYYNTELNSKFGLVEYYALTDLKPGEISRLARRNKNINLAISVKQFFDDRIWLRQPLNINKKLNLLHSVKGHELTEEEKLTVYEKMIEEGFPLEEGVFDQAAKILIIEGPDAISKEKIRNKVLNSYNGICEAYSKTPGNQKKLSK